MRLFKKRYVVTDGHIGPGEFFTYYFANRAMNAWNRDEIMRKAGIWVTVRRI